MKPRLQGQCHEVGQQASKADQPPVHCVSSGLASGRNLRGGEQSKHFSADVDERGP